MTCDDCQLDIIRALVDSPTAEEDPWTERHCLQRPLLYMLSIGQDDTTLQILHKNEPQFIVETITDCFNIEVAHIYEWLSVVV